MKKKQSSRAGFTLIELMIAVAIVAILASIAYPSYLNHVDRSRRAEAMSSLATLASAQERFFTVNGRYATAAELGADAGGNIQSENNTYNLTSVYIGANNSTYRLTATPLNWNDATCGTFSLSNIGTRWVSADSDGDGNDGDAADADGDVADQDDIEQCWR